MKHIATVAVLVALALPMFAQAYAERDGRNARYEAIEECIADGGSQYECEDDESWGLYAVLLILLIGYLERR